jgi:S-formylglutathione hydrolase FrmB
MAIYGVEYYSKTLNRNTKFFALIPNDISDKRKLKYNCSYNRKMKTLYLLHGYGGDETTFINTTPIMEYSFKYNIAIILPAGKNSYYLNNLKKDGTYLDKGYETFITKELIEFTRKSFNLSCDREDTFIGGMSMGGFGSIHSALSSPETFSKAIGISPALIIDNLVSNEIDYTHGSKHFLQRIFGNFNKLQTSTINPKTLYERNEKNKLKNPSFYIAIGEDDFLLKGTQNFVEFLKKNKADLQYIKTEGNHNIDFLIKMLEPSIKWLFSK